MAESRLEKLGSIFTRVQNLMRSGAMRNAKKPIWYDVYAAFPPLREPIYRNPHPLMNKTKDMVPPILYPEDQIRVKFYEAYGTGPGVFELAKSNYKSPCQRFVEKYNELKEQGETDEDVLFAKTGKALLAEGLVLPRKGRKMPPSAMPGLDLHYILQEEQDRTEEQEPKTEPSEKPKEESSS